MFVSLEKIDYVSLGIFLCDIVYMCIMVRLENFFFCIILVLNDKLLCLFKFNIYIYWWYFFNFF